MMTTCKKHLFGSLPDGRSVQAFTLSCGALTATIVEYGATLVSLVAPDRNGDREEITLCHRTIDELQSGTAFYGATIGRVGNRIAGGKFTIDEIEYQCPTNNGPNCLHGGSQGFDKCLWSGAIVHTDGSAAVTFSLESPDGDQGFPGAVSAAVTYSLISENVLRLDYHATTSKPTALALTNHTYWNLSGNCRDNILQHRLTMPSSNSYLPVDDSSIPVGSATVDNTPYDFRKTYALGDRIQDIEGDPGGYDHCYIVNADATTDADGLREVAIVECNLSGRSMQVFSDQPGVQLYTGNYLDGDGVHIKHGAMCLETQAYPDAINSSFKDQVLLRPGQTWKSTTLHRFATY
jgi:aldose 1-epimerase